MNRRSLTGKVVTAACGRFHMFDQARELSAHGLLHTLLTDYPRTFPVRFGVEAAKVRPLLLNGVVKQALARLPMPSRAREISAQAIHSAFSKRIAHLLPAETGFFIGLSSFCLEALQVCRDLGIPCAVDHGSLHQRYERQLMIEESHRWQIARPSDLPPEWLITKQDNEYQLADHIFVLSQAASRSLADQGISANKIFVNNCGVDISTFSPGPKHDDTFRILQVGGVNLRKGVPDLLEAFALARLPRAELEFVGGGRGNSGIDTLIQKLAGSNVRFHEPVPQHNLRNFYQQSSVFVLASIADGFGMVVPQAMACGLPVIVTENVGARDLVKDGVNGFVVPIRSPQLIADRLRQLHDAPQLRLRMGAAAADSVRSGYTWRDYGDRLAAFLRGQEDSP